MLFWHGLCFKFFRRLEKSQDYGLVHFRIQSRAVPELSEIMKKIVFFAMLAISSSFSSLSWSQDVLGGLLGRQGNPQMRGMGILPNDQLVDSNGQPIRDLNAANSFLQANQNLRVRRNGQIVTVQQSKPQSSSNTSQLGWSFGTRNNSVFISSLVSNSLAAQAGLRAGDQIVNINGNAIGRPEDISTYLLQANNWIKSSD